MSSRSKKRAAQSYAKLCAETVSPLMLVPWTPFEQVEIPGHPEVLAFQNSRYLVQVKRDTNEFGVCLWLSIRMLDRTVAHDFRDLQTIKNELAGEECEAVELFPAESRLVDGANQTHLWCFPGVRFPFGFGERLVSEESITMPGHSASVQRPFEREPKTRQVVVHLNGDSRDNSPENVRIENAKENT